MRFRIRARNPKTHQAHQFEVEGESRGDARDQVEDAGLVPSSIEPAASPDPPADGGAQESRPPRKLAPRRPRRAFNIILWLGILTATGATVPIMLSSHTTTFESLDASIRFDGFQFKIINQDDFAWHDVRFDLNGGLAHSGYLHRPGTLVEGQVYTAPVTAFTDEEGNRFNPVTESLRQLIITCELEDGKTARYTRRWN
jgi:hypothetical protein